MTVDHDQGSSMVINDHRRSSMIINTIDIDIRIDYNIDIYIRFAPHGGSTLKSVGSRGGDHFVRLQLGLLEAQHFCPSRWRWQALLYR